MKVPGRPMLLVMLMGSLLAACGTPPDPPSLPTVSPPASATSAPATSASPTVAPTPSPAPSPTPEPTPPRVADDPPPLGLELVASGFAAPTNVVGLPDGGLLVAERSGRVLAVHPSSGAVSEVVDLSDRVTPDLSGSDERGLLGLALHPDWPGVGRAFVHYTDRSGTTTLSELKGDDGGGSPRLDPGSEAILLRVAQPYVNHNGGQLAFGPDGMLWMGLGDGGAGGDPHGTGQNPDDLLGSILRLDVSEPRAAVAPPDAPFADGGGAPEVHLYGLRNPWRFSFDRLTGELWIADVGQRAFEEVDRVNPVADAGGNLGWNVMEGAHCFVEAGCSSEGLILPVSEYGREQGCSIIGGYVYRGSVIEGLGGWYLFGDWCSGTVFGIPSDVAELTLPRTLLTTDAAITAFGEDADGELYLADQRGGIYRITRGG